MTRHLVAPCALLLLLAACPPRGPVERPRPGGWSRWDAKARLDRRLQTLGAGPAAARARAEAHRDLGWLLMVHFGDAKRAETSLDAARRDAGQRRAPWVWAGLALLHDLRLDADRAAAAWLAVLEQLTRGGSRLTPPAGLSGDGLALLAVDRLTEQLPHLAKPVSEEALERLHPKLPPKARAALGLALVSLARLRGEEPALRRRLTAAGCLDRYTLSRRYGRYGRIDLDREFAPERSARLPGRAARGASCGITVRSPAGHAGVRYAEVRTRTAKAGPAQVHVGWSRPFVLFVNGRRVFGPEDRHRPRPMLRQIQVTLPAGRNRLLFKLPVSATPARLQALITYGPATPRRGAKARAPVDGLFRPLARALDVHGALHVGLPDRGRLAAAGLTKEAPRFTWGRLAVAELERRDPLQPPRLGVTRAKVILQQALDKAPWASRIRLRLASLLRHQSKTQQALTLLRAGTWTAAATRLAAVARVRLYRDLGWRVLALREARKLTQKHPRWLPAWKLCYVVASASGATQTTLRAARRIRRLDATSIAWARTLASQGRHDEAVREARRLLGLRDDDRALYLLAEQLRLGSRPALGAHRTLLGRSRWETEYRISLANLLIGRGRRAEAVALLREGHEEHPESADLGRALRALGEPDPLEPHRVSGKAAVAAYRKARWGSGKAPVYVLDRSVVLVQRSGGRRVLTHQIVHLRSKAAVARYGEVKLPGGVRVLTLRTLKADGTVREPEDVGEKDSVSLTDVDVGDLVEVEYISAHAAQPFWPKDGFYGTSFSFRSLGAHFFRSELVVITPQAMPLSTSTWGAVPKPVVRLDGGRRITRWTAHRVELLRREPRVPHLAGVLPTVLVGSRVTWPAYLRQRQELEYGTDVASHEVRALARSLCAGKPAAQQARALYAWVQKNVEESGSYYVSAARTLAARSGSRITLLRTLLRECRAGRVETWLVRPRQLHLGRGQVPVVRMYSQPLLRVQPRGKAAVYLLPQLQQAPFGYLPPTYRRASSVVVERPDATVSLTPDQPEADARETTLTVLLEPDGSGVVLGQEKLSGLTALQFRAALRRVPAKHLRQWLERAFFGRVFAGAVITRLSFKNAKKLDRPLFIVYRLQVPRLALTEGGAAGQTKKLVIRSGFFPTLLGRIFAPLSRRRLPLLLGPVGPLRLTLTVQPPVGFRATGLPRPVRLRTPFGRFGLQVKRAGRAVEIRRSLSVPFRVVQPAQYPAFSLFAARVDRAERLTVVLER